MGEARNGHLGGEKKRVEIPERKPTFHIGHTSRGLSSGNGSRSEKPNHDKVMPA